MIKKYYSFINEVTKIKNKYEFLHLNNKEKKEYLSQRMDDIQNSGMLYNDYEAEFLTPQLLDEYMKNCIEKNRILTNGTLECLPNNYLNKYLINRINFCKKYNDYTEEVKKYLCVLTDYEWDLCNTELKNNYTNDCIYRGFGLTKYMLNNLSHDLVNKYNFTKNLFDKIEEEDKKAPSNYTFDDSDFNSCTDELKNQFIIHCNNKGRELTDIQYNWASYKLKIGNFSSIIKYYDGLSDKSFNRLSDQHKYLAIEKLTTSANPLTKNQWDWCSNDLKYKYILKFNYMEYILPNDIFDSCDEETKIENIKSVVKKRGLFSDEIFKRLPNNLKRIAIENIINTVSKEISNLQIEWCKKRRKLYINYLVKKVGAISEKDFLKLSDKEKIYYIKLCKIEKIYITYDIKKWFDNYIK